MTETKRALLVSDHWAVREGIEIILEGMGLEVISTEGLPEACAALANQPGRIDVIVTDYWLDNKWTTAHDVESLFPPDACPPIVVTTGDTCTGMPPRWTVVHKPMSPQQLMAAVAAAMRRRPGAVPTPAPIPAIPVANPDAASLLLAPRQPDAHRDPRLGALAALAQATEYELLDLWRAHATTSRERRSNCFAVSWVSGHCESGDQVGTADGRPVRIAFHFATIEGKPVCFWTPTSPTVNLTLIRAWLTANTASADGAPVPQYEIKDFARMIQDLRGKAAA